MNGGMKDMLQCVNKFLAIGLTLEEVVLRATWNPAQEILREELGQLSVGSVADVAVFRLETGDFGFIDSFGARLIGSKKLTCELTLRGGKVMYELNGITRPDWQTLPGDYRSTGDARWDAISPRRRR